MVAEPSRSTPSPAPRDPTPGEQESPDLPRIFLHEPGWRVAMKVGSQREFCYQIAPGQDYYHRLLDGELHVFRADERLCLPCAHRRGLLSFEARSLKPSIVLEPLDQHLDPADPGFDLIELDD